jgi:thymidylate synthase
LTTYQRSADIPLGLPFNLIQGHTLLSLVAQASGLKVGKLFMKFTNLHIYEDQLKGIMEQRKRVPNPTHTKLFINNVNEFTNLKKVTLDNFSLGAYKSYPSIKFPFSV